MRLTPRQHAELALLRYGTLTEAFVTLIFARLALRVFFRRVTRWALDRHPRATAEMHPHLTSRMQWAISSTTRVMPGEGGCLPNAIAAKAMLARRGISSTIHLGVGRHTDGALRAHAWLEAGGTILTGAEAIPTVTHLPR